MCFSYNFMIGEQFTVFILTSETAHNKSLAKQKQKSNFITFSRNIEQKEKYYSLGKPKTPQLIIPLLIILEILPEIYTNNIVCDIYITIYCI